MSILDLINSPESGKDRKAGLTFDKTQERFAIAFDSDVSKAEVMEQWERFSKMRKELTGKTHTNKRRKVTNEELLLQVKFFKELGASYRQIHEAFLKNEVPYFKGDYSYDTEFDLKKYYERNISKI